MKKFLLTVAALATFGLSQAQDASFGVKAGFTSLSGKAEVSGFGSVSESDSGFYIGGFADLTVSDKFHVQPELLYIAVSDANQVQIPIHAKYMVIEGLGVKAGPSFSFLTDVPDGMKSFNYGLDLGAEYNFAENFVVDAKYSIGLADLSDIDGLEYKLSGFFVGVGYKF
ncbi:porin family protein [Flavobacterium sp. U410]